MSKPFSLRVIFVALVAVLLVLIEVASTSALTPVSPQSIAEAFRQYKDVPAANISIVVPTVVDVSFDSDSLESTNFAVYDNTSGQFEPSLFIQTILPTAFTASSNTGDAPALVDNDTESYATFDVPGDRPVRTSIHLNAPSAITASTLVISLDDHVAFPLTVSIRTATNVVVAERSLDGVVVRFPQTRSQDWVIEFVHVQPLRIAELRIVEDKILKSTHSLRFLAQPKHSYRVYFNPDRSVDVPIGEAGNLADNRGVRKILAGKAQQNPTFTPADSDNDSVPDARDNCVSISNPDQEDIDENGLGDMCQDFDRDRVPNFDDNCTNDPNANQSDVDGDGIGDECDGEESRLTESYPWIPWVGIGFAALVILVLFTLTVRHQKVGESANGGEA